MINEINKILNLKSNDSISEELAHRQLMAITKSFQYLNKEANNIIYIADEVGLGKTYIASGIIMLFRHFSDDVQNHKDLIIVPKKNLQDKWKKELLNFVENNYRCTKNDLIKNQYSNDGLIKDRLMPIRSTDPISIFRMTSFSTIAGIRNKKTELYDYLLHEIFNKDEFVEGILSEAWQLSYFNKGRISDLRKLVAFLMNALSPKINCLIVDEAHNYKYGIGTENYDESIRNEITARFLGAVRDNSILNDFPALKRKVKFPLAEKIICLSATPKDRSLIEIKKQFHCFTNSHVLSDAITEKEIECQLKKFLLRGNMECLINHKTVSRNQCRLEHRQGNVNKSEIPRPLIIEDNFDSIFWQLLQYKSIKHLNQKNNASFEIGMLASFETYRTDIERNKIIQRDDLNEPEVIIKGDKEYEQTKPQSSVQNSQDINIIREVIDSYYEEFETYPPHPKQSKLEEEIIKQLKKQEKSLIFMRRIASCYELENRIKKRFEKEIIVGIFLDFTGEFKKYRTRKIDLMLRKFDEAVDDSKIAEHLDVTLKKLLEKNEIKNVLLSFREISDSNYLEEGLIWLKVAYRSNPSPVFKNAINDYITRSLINISQSLKDTTIKALSESYREYKLHSDKDNGSESESDDLESGYFFLDYFKKERNGFPYRQKMYRENWFEINLIQLNNHFKFIEYPVSGLNDELRNIKEDPKRKKNQLFKIASEAAFGYLNQYGKRVILSSSINETSSSPLNEPTFLTTLLCKFCSNEMQKWLNKRLFQKEALDGPKEKILYNALENLKILNMLLRNIFRNGSGLLPGFIADSTDLNYDEEFLNIISNIESPFAFVLNEIKTIINDFDLIISVNFQEKDESRINATLRNLTPIVGTTGQDHRDRGLLAAQFRMPGYPYVLITTDVFREGEDLHTYCQNVYHYGIAWNPSDMEQRTGRIDRINSLSYRLLNQTQQLDFENKVQVFYPYLQNSVEVNQVVQLLRNVNKFINDFNNITVNNEYGSSVSINEQVFSDNIPPQITDTLISKYDIKDFET